MVHEVVAALIIRSGLILLGQRSATRMFYPAVWDIFGGHVESGEQYEQTLIRELEEELGITPSRWTFLGTTTQSLPAQPGSNESPDLLTVHLYLVTEWTGSPINLQPEEHSAIGWFSLAQVTQLNLADQTYPMLFAQYLHPDPKS